MAQEGGREGGTGGRERAGWRERTSYYTSAEVRCVRHRCRKMICCGGGGGGGGGGGLVSHGRKAT